MSKLLLGVVGLGLVIGAAACTRANPAFCTSNSDCTNPSQPFCDVSGQFGSESNDCIAQPATDAAVISDAPHVAIDAPPSGCTPGAVLACTNDTLTTCAADGHTTTPTACPLGCATAGTRCATFAPSHGLGPALASAGSAFDVTIPRGSTINTDTGAILDSLSQPVTVTTMVVPQAGGPSIRAFIGTTFSIDDVVVTGSNALAFAASGEIHIVGDIDARGHSKSYGPGSVKTGPCVGTSTVKQTVSGGQVVPGSGGGGNATAGGAGGQTNTLGGGPGGAALGAMSALSGGCASGVVNFLGDTEQSGGGGALQLDSLTSVVIDTAGVIDVGGGGGIINAVGGGAGGTVVIEAPTLSITGARSGVVANGGAGGGCDAAGQDGSFQSTPALSVTCTTTEDVAGGNGGTGSTLAAAAPNCHVLGQGCGATMFAGGGGGAVGTLLIATRTSGYVVAANPIISASTSESALTTE